MLQQRDLRILQELRKNARQTITSISKKTDIPITTVCDRLKRMSESIKKHTTLPDFSKLGFNAKTNIAIRVDRNSKEALQKFLAEHSSTNTLYKVNYGFDFLGEFIFKDLNEAHNFAELIEKKFNAKVQLMNVIEEIKKEEFLSKELNWWLK